MSAGPLGWQDRAACRGAGLALFFTPEAEHPDTRRARERAAKAICAGCPVRFRCLMFRLSAEGQHDGGIWGGADEHERTRMRRNMLRAQRQRKAAA